MTGGRDLIDRVWQYCRLQNVAPDDARVPVVAGAVGGEPDRVRAVLDDLGGGADPDGAEESGETTETAEEEPRGDGSPADDPQGVTGVTGAELDKYRRVYLDAVDRAGREPWEPVEEAALREALAAIGFEELLDDGALFDIRPWRFVDVSSDDEEPRRRWYYPSGDEPRTEEFRRFDELLRAAAPDDYEPHYFRVAKASKDPATQYGSWKTDEARLSVDEAVEWMEEGGNVGIAGTPDDPLINVDIDDDEATTPDDVPTSLRARSRSRTGWHTWYFDEDGDVPNIPTDTAGEIRTDWQYVVAPGSFVASCREEIPDDADRPGYYTVEDEEPVVSIEYEDLPEVFRDFAAEVEAAEEETAEGTDPDEEFDVDVRDFDLDDDGSAVFDVEAADLVSATHDDADRFSSIFHGSGTGANMSVSGDKLHCWRHGVAHGGLQALATLSDVDHVRTYGCGDLGAAHKNSGAGSNQLKGDWRLVWGAWHEAKDRGAIPDDDPLPYRALRELAVADDIVDQDDLVERDVDTGEVASDDAEETYLALPAGTYNDVLEHVETEYGVDPGREPVGGGYDPDTDTDGGDRSPAVVECAPPADDLDPADVDAIRARMRGPLYDAVDDDDADTPTVWGHAPGTGKTTTAHLAAADRDRPVAYLFDKHRKAHEHRSDDVTPDVDLHLRGAAQPRDDACARVAYGDGPAVCPDHGDTSNCPRMCPIYDLPPDHPDRQRFEAVAAEVGPTRAHVILEPHGGDDCAWFDALAAAPEVDSLVGVHQYQRLKTVCAPGGDERDVIVDESPADLADDRRLTVEDLIRLSNSLEGWSGRDAAGETLRRCGRFARDLADAVVDDTDLATLDPPAPVWDSYESYDDVAGGYMEYVDPDPDEPWQVERALTDARRLFLDYHLGAIRDEDREWDGTPLAFDALLAAAVEAGLPADPARAAAGRQFDLTHCPRCRAGLEHEHGRRVCHGCEWDESEDTFAAGEADPARILAWVDHDGTDAVGEDVPGLVRRRLPALDSLPDDPLVLDATATPEKVAAFYGVDQDAVDVHGDGEDALDNLHLTQITDGQYHFSTLENAVEEGHASADRIQTHLDRVGELHDRPLVVGRREVRDLFDLPENAEFIHYGGGRGLNFEDCDAVVAVGAPHPKMDDLRRRARLLAQGRDDLRIGGVEHSPRNDCPNPPVYRKLRYTDDDGQGRAVATKHYTGLVGALFREAREKELEQMLHRIRPLLADDLKHGYLLTNVPTSVPVDEVCSLKELTETPAAMLPVADGALDLAHTLADVAAGASPDGFRAGALVERDGEGGVRFRIREVHRLARATGQDVAERTVRRWVDDLRDLGLVDAGEYQPRAGVPYSTDGATLTRALSVLSSNAGVEVAVKRRLAALAADLDSAAEWIRRARGLVDLSGLPPDGAAGENRGGSPSIDPG